MSNLKLGLYLFAKTIGITACITFILYTAVSEAWVFTSLSIFLPLCAYYMSFFFLKVIELKNKMNSAEDKVQVILDKIEKMKDNDKDE